MHEPPAQPRGQEAALLVFSQIEAKKRGKHGSSLVGKAIR